MIATATTNNRSVPKQRPTRQNVNTAPVADIRENQYLGSTQPGMAFKNISDNDQVQLMNNKDKISTFSYIRQQTRKQSKDTKSSFPPVSNSFIKDGISATTKDYGDHWQQQ